MAQQLVNTKFSIKAQISKTKCTLLRVYAGIKLN